MQLSVQRHNTNCSHLPIPGVMEPCIRGEHEQTAHLVAPADLLLAHDGLHDRVEPALWCVQVAGYVGARYCVLR